MYPLSPLSPPKYFSCIYKLLNIYCIYMAKKYLLYIHNDHRFEQEKNKSALVNKLLDDYYGGPSKRRVNLIPLTGKRVIEVIPDLLTELCPHGYPLTTCPKSECTRKARDKGLV